MIPPEHTTETADAHRDVHGEAMALLQTLHARSLQRKPDDEHILERMIAQIEQKTRSITLVHLRTVEHRLRERYRDSPSEQIEALISRLRMDTISKVFAENSYDSILSTPGYPIHAKRYGRSLLRTAVRRMMAQEAPPEALQSVAWISFDANALKGLIDCTTRDTATRYLQAASRLLLNKQGPTRKWLEEEFGASVTPLTAGGDEFALLVQSPEPLPAEVLDRATSGFQSEFTESPILRGFLDFDNPNVIKQFCLVTDDDRERFEALKEPAKEAAIKKMRSPLPDEFEPSFSGGWARLDEAVSSAVASGDLNLNGDGETFDSSRRTIFRHLIETAENREKLNKLQFKKQLRETNPKMAEFMMRTKESRRQSRKTILAERRATRAEAVALELRSENNQLRSVLSARDRGEEAPVLQQQGIIRRSMQWILSRIW
jgi:hypothetical protein